MADLNLAFGVTFEELYTRDGAVKLDEAFVDELKATDVELFNRFMEARAKLDELEAKDESNLLIDVAPHLEDFIGKLFGIGNELRGLRDQHNALANVYACKRLFVQRRAAKVCKPEDANDLNGEQLEKELEKIIGEPVTERTFSNHVMKWIDGTKGVDIPGNEGKTEVAAKYAAWALMSDAGIEKHKDGVLFQRPNKMDFDNLVPVETELVEGITRYKLPDHDLRYRDGFKLTDEGGSLEEALDEANYCIYCHNQGKDSCSKGLKDKPDAETGKAPFKESPFGVQLAGCPLEEKISEMNTLKANGTPLGALGIVTIDNPMCAGTGHRICNDCMKSCIYQKQDPVNIPLAETRTLQDVLDLPWGFEIYSLLTRWNPLNLRRPVPKEDSGYKVLIAGLGPAGFTLAHHLMNDGHTVVGVDGLKIEPVPEEISGVNQKGERVEFKPIEDVQELFEKLDERTLAGFGGVAEYGITVRWNKNYLKLIRLLLERRKQFGMFGGVRFGSTITYDTAWELGFDHVALALGAGKPTIVSMPNALARGVRTASDFLMALQLTGAAKKDSIANLQLRLPVVVIGGGLTAIDTATESMAYYPLQVEKFLKRYEILVREKGEDAVRANWTDEETDIAEEFIAHAKAFREEKAKAEAENRDPDNISLIKSWGGVTLAYRKTLSDAPAYRLNHEEIEKALEEGIFIMEDVSPAGVQLDDFGAAKSIRLNHNKKDEEGHIIVEEKVVPARAIFMAAGTNPNTVLAREDAKHFELDGKYFRAINEKGEQVTPQASTSKPESVDVLMAATDKKKFISYFGDLHPSYVGNVVKAMGSAKQGYPVVSQVLAKAKPATKMSPEAFLESIADQLIATVVQVNRLTPTIVEVVVRAPLAAKEFQPGQFYRLQNYENQAMVSGEGEEKTKLAMEGLALTGAWVDRGQGLMGTIVLEMGGSSDLCAYLREDEPVVCMGPTGTPTDIPANDTVMLVGGGLGNAVLFSIGKALKANGSKVLYFAGYKKKIDRYKIEEIEAASDVIIWCCDEGELDKTRDNDFTYHGNIVEAIKAYGTGELGDIPIPTQDVGHIITIGSDRMMAAVGQSRHTVLKDLLKPDHEAIGSINSPMQCMMKEICAQCLQQHIDPETGERVFVYSCFNQDQCLDKVNFQHLNTRLKQNTLQEKLTAHWIDRCLQQQGLRETKAA